MINYTASIYEESGSNLTPTMSAIVTSSIQVIGVYCSTLLVDRAGRKVRNTLPKLFIIFSKLFFSSVSVNNVIDWSRNCSLVLGNVYAAGQYGLFARRIWLDPFSLFFFGHVLRFMWNPIDSVLCSS